MVRTIYAKPDSGRTGKIFSNLGFRRGRWLFSQDFLDLGFGIWGTSCTIPLTQPGTAAPVPPTDELRATPCPACTTLLTCPVPPVLVIRHSLKKSKFLRDCGLRCSPPRQHTCTLQHCCKTHVAAMLQNTCRHDVCKTHVAAMLQNTCCRDKEQQEPPM